MTDQATIVVVTNTALVEEVPEGFADMTIGGYQTDLAELADRGVAGTWMAPGHRYVFALDLAARRWHLQRWVWIFGWSDAELAMGADGKPPVGGRAGKDLYGGAVADHELHLFGLGKLEVRVGNVASVPFGIDPLCGRRLWSTPRADWKVFQTGGDPRRLVHIVGHKVTVCKSCSTIDPKEDPRGV